jgi:protein-tyrosine-phosphatase
MTSNPSKKPILFVCVENAGRSQMAEGFFRKYATIDYEPLSAGTQPVDSINPLAIQVMREVGIDISNQKSKILSEEMIKRASRTVNMGCMDKQACPALFVEDIVDWSIPDPKGKSIEEVRRIRDVIEIKVKELVSSLG